MENSSPCYFNELKLEKKLLKTLEKIGFKTATDIQKQVIPCILEGKDVIAQALTGSGKTAAFGLPAIQKTQNSEGIGLLVITPTRELALQVSQELNRFAQNCDFQALAVYGGQPISTQIKKIRQGVQAIVATPGRLLDLLKSKKLKHFSPSIAALDEADEMLEIGFLEDIKEIFSLLEGERQTLLFSATMPKSIQNLAHKILKNPVSIQLHQQATQHNDIHEIYHLAKEKEKDCALIRLLDHHSPLKSIVFCRTKSDVQRLHDKFATLGYQVRCLHGDMGQNERQSAIKSFRDGDCKLLVASDVAARGLNVLDISHVFNYHIPFCKESYTHRIGRTGRAGRKGTAITLISPSEFYPFSRMRTNKIQLDPLPTLTEVKKRDQHNLVQTLLDQKDHRDSQTLLETLQQKLEPEQISLSLLSFLLHKKSYSGPEAFTSVLEKKFTQNPKKPFKRKRSPRNRPFFQKDAKGFKEKRKSFGRGKKKAFSRS